MSDTIELDRESDPQAVRGYAFYDWAKSAFETSVTTAILPVWFASLFLEANGLTTTVLGKSMSGDAIWSFAVAGAALLVAFVIRGNLIASMIGTAVGNPFTFPFIWLTIY